MPKLAKLSDAELVERLQLVEKHGNISRAARAIGINPGSMGQSVLQARHQGLTAQTKILDEKEKLRLKLADAERRIKSLERDNDTADAVRTAIYGLTQRDLEPPAWLTRNGTTGRRGAPMTIWSDWHRGEVVRSEEVAGVNEFNSEVHDARVKKLVQTTIDLAFNHMGRAKTTYPGIVICLGGDFINGDIHDELIIGADRTTQQNVNEMSDLLAAAIDNMAVKFGNVFLPCVVGNHGRATLKPRTKGRVYTSHEWNIYCNLARFFKGNKHVRFMIPDQTDAFFKVYGHRFLLTHGDSMGVKGGDGIIGALGPIMRGSIKVGRSEAHIGRDFDTIIMGHWHQYLTLPGVIVNNALKGYDEFARLVLRAPYSRPSQALWFVHPEHGITAHWQVYLEKLRTANDDAVWLEYPGAGKRGAA